MNNYLTINQLVSGYLGKRSRSIHYKVKALMFAADVVNQCRLQAYNHRILKREKNSAGTLLPYFRLPEDFIDWISLGAREGAFWQPVPVETDMMGYLPASASSYDGAGIKPFVDGDVLGSWPAVDAGISGQLQNPGFPYKMPFPLFYKGSIAASTAPHKRCKSVMLSPRQGLIMTPDGAGDKELYLVYVGSGKINTMTHIDRDAVELIEAYMDWQWAARRRNGAPSAEAMVNKSNYEDLLKRYRRKSKPAITKKGLQTILDKNYGTGRGM